jgi:hypothetical protein
MEAALYARSRVAMITPWCRQTSMMRREQDRSENEAVDVYEQLELGC